MKKLIFVIPFVIGFLFQTAGFAQIKSDGITPKPLTATISAKGIVLAPISVVSTHDLDFGSDILPGVNRTIDKNSNSAGKFSIMGESGKEVTIELSLPPELISGEEHLMLGFSPTDGGYKLPGGNVVEFDPVSSVNAVFGTDGAMDILLGGTVQPTYTQPAGLYEGTVTVTLYYTGN